MFREMCKSVQRVHAQDVVHRDLKPSNFLIMANGQVKLADFGTGKSLKDAPLATYGGPVGDTGYSAPELFAGLHDIDPRFAIWGDVYSLGAILFELFAGEPLANHLLRPQFVRNLLLFNKLAPDQRRYVYDQVVETIADAQRPSVRAFGATVPPSIRDRIDALYRELAHLDYRKRLLDFSRVFRQIEMCLLVVRNEAAYQRWLTQRRQRRAMGTAPRGAVR
jgi:serine/threonine protein kinase